MNDTSNDISLLSQPEYDPNALFDILIDRFGLKYDAALAGMLEVAPPVISKIRHLKMAIGATLLLRIHDVTDLSIRELRALMGDRRDKFRMSL